jgi:hypothetical protein
MWSMSGAARQLLGQSHTMNAKLEVLHAGQVVYTLAPYSGTVNAAAGRPVMRNLGCTVIDPTGRLGGGDVDDLLSPYDCEVKPYRGVATPSGWEWTPQGVFQLTSRNVVGDGQVQVTGQDRAMIFQGGMGGQVAINANTPVEDAIQALLSTRMRGLQMRSWVTGYVVGPLLYQADIDVWAEAQKLAQSIGGWLWHDREGLLHFSSLAPPSQVISHRYDDGDGLLLTANRKENSDTIHNVVVVQNASQQTGTVSPAIISAQVADTDPTSPTYYKGRYGTRVLVITNQTITTLQQAQQAAAIALIIELGRSETATISVVPHPALDPLDMITVNRPSVGLVARTLVIQEIELPLTARDAMGIQFRKYILTENGQTVQTTVAVNA